ncbi:MAG: hypothetical protein ACREXK_01490 [Gammaproteobacteria bacterium]
MFPPATANDIARRIGNLLGNSAVAAAWPWHGGVPISVGAAQLRIQLDGGQWCVRQFFFDIAPGLGHAVDQNVLRCIAAKFPSLVY